MTEENKDFTTFDAASSAPEGAPQANVPASAPEPAPAPAPELVPAPAPQPAYVSTPAPAAPADGRPVNPFEEQGAFAVAPQQDFQPTQQQPRVEQPQVAESTAASGETATDAGLGAEAYVPAQESAPRQKREHPAIKAGLMGIAGGVVGSLAIVLALRSAGTLPGNVVANNTNSAAGQTVAITPQSTDVTVSQAVAAKALPSVVSVYVTTDQGEGLGSGVVLDETGNILTNWHVAGDAKSINVTLGGKNYEAKLVGGDSSSDLAVVKAELGDDKVTPIEVGDSDKLVVGDWVMTIGSPFGLDQSVSAGIVSSLARNELMQSTYGTTIYANLIQTDACINPGNSGGALVNSEGKLVGISTLFSSDTESFAGIGFAIPGNYAIEIANKIIAGEQVTHAYIGLTMQTVTARNAAAHNLPVKQGAYVAEVANDSPAAAAGIKVGDIITAMGDQEITSADGMILAVRSHSIGEKVTITAMRGKEEKKFEVTLGSDEALQLQQEQQKQQWLEEPQGEQNQQYQQYQQNPQGNGYEDVLEEIMRQLYGDNHGGVYTQE